MPIYEYTCDQCGARFEKLIRRMSDESAENLPSCPDCSSANTHRIMSAFAHHGKPGIDYEAAQAEHTQAEKQASITPKSLIDKWRSGDQKD